MEIVFIMKLFYLHNGEFFMNLFLQMYLLLDFSTVIYAVKFHITLRQVTSYLQVNQFLEVGFEIEDDSIHWSTQGDPTDQKYSQDHIGEDGGENHSLQAEERVCC